MAEKAELDDFELIILARALSYGKVSSSDVSFQIQELLKEKQQPTGNYYDTFNKTIVKLQKKGLLDEKNRPTAPSENVPLQILRNAIVQAHRRIIEHEEEIKHKNDESSQLRSQVYSLESEVSRLKSQIDLMSPPTQFISKESLAKGLRQFVGNDILNKLSNVAKNDLENAMRCIMHGISTPAAMVSLRASEEVVRAYYKYKTEQEPGKITWKEILDQLLERNDVNRTLIGHLNYIREKRNQAEHPDKIFDQFEAETTFQTVVNAIRDIYSEMQT